MARKEANMEIVRLMVNYMNMHPDQRFNQILEQLNLIKYQEQTNTYTVSFYEEPTETLERVKNTLRGKHD